MNSCRWLIVAGLLALITYVMPPDIEFAGHILKAAQRGQAIGESKRNQRR